MNQNNRETVCSMRRQGYYDSIECKQVILLTGFIQFGLDMLKRRGEGSQNWRCKDQSIG